jgi:glycosyltransferase involved in cell wall biosynthesis
MRIALDARPLCLEQSHGIPNYVRGMLKALAAVDRENEYILYAHKPFLWEGNEKRRWPSAMGRMYGTLWLETVVPAWLSRDRIDVFWGTQHVLPVFHPRKIRTVLTVHDLVYRRVPETMQAKNRWISRLLMPPSVRRAGMLAADSRDTADDLVRLLGAPRSKIRVVHLGLDPEYRPVPKREAIRFVEKEFKIRPPFILTVGTLEPRKNLATTLDVFSRIAPRLPHGLCIAGASGWKLDGWLNRRLKSESLRGRVVQMGYVSKNAMPYLYAAADVFLFPSLYEGFGFPPLEAMACGTPVVASNAPCLPEILGRAALTADPMDAARLSEHVERLLSDLRLRSEMTAAGLKRSGVFSWTKAAESMSKIFADAARRPAPA